MIPLRTLLLDTVFLMGCRASQLHVTRTEVAPPRPSIATPDHSDPRISDRPATPPTNTVVEEEEAVRYLEEPVGRSVCKKTLCKKAGNAREKFAAKQGLSSQGSFKSNMVKDCRRLRSTHQQPFYNARLTGWVTPPNHGKQPGSAPYEQGPPTQEVSTILSPISLTLATITKLVLWSVLSIVYSLHPL